MYTLTHVHYKSNGTQDGGFRFRATQLNVKESFKHTHAYTYR